MNKTRQLFHLISYLQYPLMLVVLYFYVILILSVVRGETDWAALNNALIFLGIEVGFSTLQDTTKTQNKISRRVWESPRKGKLMILLISLLVLFFLVFGLIGYFSSEENIHKEVSFGLIALGIGILGMLKSAIEMFENHRKDKQAGFTWQSQRE